MLSEPSANTVRRPPAASSLRLALALALAMALATACAAPVRHVEEPGGDDLSSRGLVLASPTTPIVPTVDKVMVQGDLSSWAEQGFDHFEGAEYAMALPYLEAALESGDATLMQRAYLHWYAGLAYREVDDRAREVASLELFLLSTEAAPQEALDDLWLAGLHGREIGPHQARELARAKLLAYRLERRGGFGGPDDPVIVGSLREENLVLTLLRCGPERQERVDLLGQELQEREGHRFDLFHARCADSGDELRVHFDVTDAFGRPAAD